MFGIGEDAIGYERDRIPDWKKVMLVFEILTTWMIWFKYNGSNIICIQFMD